MTFDKLEHTAKADRLPTRHGTSETAVASMQTSRKLIAAAVSALAFGLLVFSTASHSQTTTIDTESSVVAAASQTRRAGAEDRSIRPFKAHVPQAQIDELRRRIAATRFPERETVNDFSQGVQLERLKPLVEYWGKSYDWRKAEAKLNALPQFVSKIDGLDMHFIHVRSRHPNALPMLMPHGWPGSVFELLKVVDPLVNPTAHGGRAEDAFHLVLPSLPGYGFSGKPTDTAWNPDQMGRAFHELMQRLGYSDYVAQGGDWGAIIAEVMAVQAPKGLLGIHVNMPGTVPPSVLDLVRLRQPAPATFSEEEKTAFAGLEYFYRKGFGYAEMMNTRPQTLGYSLADSPVGMLAFYYDKFTEWTHSNRQPEKVLTRDDILDQVTLYWLTNTGTSSSRSYWDAAQGGGGPFNAVDITQVPVAVTVFPGEIYRAPRSWGEQAFKKLIYWNEVDKGGHFAANEQPQLFAEEMRKAFKPLRSQ